MRSLSFVFRTDVHMSDKSPDSWKGDYPAELWSDLDQIRDLAQQCHAKAVLDGGDFFNVKAPTRNSHGLVARTARVHAKYTCPVYAIEGNHDLQYNNLDSIDRQPLGVLYDSGVFRQLRDEVFEDDGLRVRVVGVPYLPNRDLESFHALRKQPGDDYLVAVVHALAAKNPPAHVADFYGEPVFRYQDLVFDGGPDVYCFGHWHHDQGAEHIDGRWFVNQGAVSRGALTHDNLDRVPKVAVITASDQGCDVQLVPMKIEQAAVVFDLERKDRRDREGEIIESFVQRIEDEVQLDSASSIEESVRRLEFAPEIRDLALHYLELARGR